MNFDASRAAGPFYHSVSLFTYPLHSEEFFNWTTKNETLLVCTPFRAAKTMLWIAFAPHRLWISNSIETLSACSTYKNMTQTFALSASRDSLYNWSCSSLSSRYSSRGSNCMNINVKIFTHNILVLLYLHDPLHYLAHLQKDSYCLHNHNNSHNQMAQLHQQSY